ncbi:MAG: DUF2764 family protein [Spirochaetales bacterium]|nr:DUF2764 family protein [Spirochaetales bacterium]
MASYYYLVASLPSLRYEGSLPFTTESFLKLCTGQLSETHLSLVRSVLLGQPCSHSFVRSYQKFASMVKKELTEQRSRKLSLSDPLYKNDGDKEARIADVVRQALSLEDVLAAEMLLVQLQWNYIDELCALHTFDIEAVLGYAIKLRMLERKSLFTREEGNAEFKRLFSNIQTEIENN